MKKLMFGNDAVVQGALEAGVGFAASYPGTPASEIGDMFAKIAKANNIYFEWSVNEKTALEAAAGAAMSGIKSIVSFKHYGMNVALDSLLPLVYTECPLVVVTADDPGCWSSVQTEQSSRWFSKLGKIPMLEPSDSEEAKEMTKKAFEIAWKFRIPVIVRMTTRVSYSKSPVALGIIPKSRPKANFRKEGFEIGAAVTVAMHKNLLEKKQKIKQLAEKSDFNLIERGESSIGVITSGISYLYVKEALQELNVKLPVLKLGFIWHFPLEKAKAFVKNLKEVIVVEELDGFIEEEIKKITNLKIYGKNLFSETGELRPEDVLLGFSKIMDLKIPAVLQENIKNFNPEKVPLRTPMWCAGCPHRATFYAVKKTLGDKIFGGDIGCYALGANKPYEMFDYLVSMGASIGISHGISKVTGKKPVVFIGDSTFFHAGIPALVNMVYNKADALVIVLDNRITAMTGQQPNPGMGMTGMGEATKAIAIEDIARACKADFVKVTNVWNFKQLCADIKEAYDKKGVSVLLAKGECRLLTVRKLAREGKSFPRFEIHAQSPKLEELKNFGCPAIQKNKIWFIDKKLCWGCSVCMQLFPDCIKVRNEKL